MMKNTLTVMLPLLLIAIFCSDLVLADGFSREGTIALAAFKAAVADKQKPPVLIERFSKVIEELATIGNEKKREDGAEELMDLLEREEMQPVVRYIFPDMLLLVHSRRYGRKNVERALNLACKYGYILPRKIKNDDTEKKDVTLAGLFCYGRSPFIDSIRKICSAAEKKETLKQEVIDPFIENTEKILLGTYTPVIPRKYIRQLIGLYYETHDVNLQQSIAFCMCLAKDYAQAYTMAKLLPKSEKPMADYIISRIPENVRGKKNPVYEEDPYEK